MKNRRRKRFNKLFAKLPAHIQKQAKKDLQFFQENPYDPTLGFKMLNKAVCAIDIGYRYRALGEKTGDTIEWFWIGSHEDYNNVIARL